MLLSVYFPIELNREAVLFLDNVKEIKFSWDQCLGKRSLSILAGLEQAKSLACFWIRSEELCDEPAGRPGVQPPSPTSFGVFIGGASQEVGLCLELSKRKLYHPNLAK